MSSNDGSQTIGDRPNLSKQLQQQQQQQQHQQQLKSSKQDTIHRYQSTGMTPSIITTINNTNPTTPASNSGAVNNNHPTSLVRNNRRTNEPYESYIEDSFVGHWEHEDDMDEYQEEFDVESPGGCEPDKSDLQHPSTIEFDFDSFGPESIIYTPPTATVQAKNNTTTSTATLTNSTIGSRPPTLLEVSPEAENADKIEHDVAPVVDNTKEGEDNTATKSTPYVDLIQNPRALNLSPPNDYLVDPEQIDLKVIEPYKKVISHAGYCHQFDPSAPAPLPGEPTPAVIVFSACYLPDRSRSDYNYVMDHLFLYVLSSLHELIADDYILIYLHNTPPSKSTSSRSAANGSAAANLATTSNENQNLNNLPTFTWMKRCYQMIDRRLRKNLKILYLVKPTFWLKTIVIMCKPFISTKFSKKLRFVENMDGLRKCLPVDKLILPASAANI